MNEPFKPYAYLLTSIQQPKYQTIYQRVSLIAAGNPYCQVWPGDFHNCHNRHSITVVLRFVIYQTSCIKTT